MERIRTTLVIISLVVFVVATFAVTLAVTGQTKGLSFHLGLHPTVLRITGGREVPYYPNSYGIEISPHGMAGEGGGIEWVRVDCQPIIVRELGPDGLPEGVAMNPTITLHHMPLLWVSITAAVASIAPMLWLRSHRRRPQRGFAVE